MLSTIASDPAEWNWYNIHKIGMLVSWGILIEVALQFGRYQRHKFYSFDFHRILASAIYLFTAASSINMLCLSKTP